MRVGPGRTAAADPLGGLHPRHIGRNLHDPRRNCTHRSPDRGSCGRVRHGSDMASAAIRLYKGFLPAASSAWSRRDALVSILQRSRCKWSRTISNGEAPIVEVGEWTPRRTRLSILTITETTLPSRADATPSTHTLTLVADQLVATDWIAVGIVATRRRWACRPAYDTAMATELVCRRWGSRRSTGDLRSVGWLLRV